MKFRNIFWGAILIIVGILFILQNLGLIYFQWTTLWRLWPVILVLWGVSIIPVKDWIKVLLVLLVLGASISFMFNRTVQWDEGKSNNWIEQEFSDDNDYDNDADRHYSTQTFNIPFEDTVNTAILNLEAAAGSFKINESSDNLISFRRRGNSSEYSYILKTTDSISEIDIEMENASVNLGDKHKNTVSLALNNYPVWDVHLETGAAEVDFDLTDYKIQNLDIDGGAASIKIKMGNKSEETHLTIEAGASSITIKIPEESGCKLNLESVLSGKNIKGFEKTDRGKYRTKNFEEASNKIYIDAEAAVSSFTIIRY